MYPHLAHETQRGVKTSPVGFIPLITIQSVDVISHSTSKKYRSRAFDQRAPLVIRLNLAHTLKTETGRTTSL